MRVKIWLIFVISLACLILEGGLIPWFIPEQWATRVSPHLILLIVLYSAVYLNRYYGLLFGLFVGILHDILYYGHMIGVYSFGMGLLGYAAGLLFQRKRMNVAMMMVVIAIALFTFDSLVYAIYRVTKVTQVTYQWALLHSIIPSLLVNLLVGLALYVPLRKLLDQPKKVEEKD